MRDQTARYSGCRSISKAAISHPGTPMTASGSTAVRCGISDVGSAWLWSAVHFSELDRRRNKTHAAPRAGTKGCDRTPTASGHFFHRHTIDDGKCHSAQSHPEFLIRASICFNRDRLASAIRVRPPSCALKDSTKASITSEVPANNTDNLGIA
jgi:hypothetical protein